MREPHTWIPLFLFSTLTCLCTREHSSMIGRTSGGWILACMVVAAAPLRGVEAFIGGSPSCSMYHRGPAQQLQRQQQQEKQELRILPRGLVRPQPMGACQVRCQREAKSSARMMMAAEEARGSKEERKRALQEGMSTKQVEMVGPLVDEEKTLENIFTAVAAADARKAEDIVCLKVGHMTVVTDFMLFLVGNSRPQNQAIAQNIVDQMEEVHGRKGVEQGTAESGWILLDYGDFIVHIMTPKSRAYYNLEGFWSKGEEVDVSDVVKPNKPASAMVGSGEEEDADVQDEEDDGKVEDDPFWA